MNRFEAVVKRVMDLMIASTAMLVLSPVLIAISLLVLCFDGRPIVYSERRVGFAGKLFTLYKFRTLNSAIQTSTVATGDDVRLTRTGSFLRRWHLDELLQVGNIILGEMSLVGPRPMKAVHAKTLPEETLGKILSFKPGLTGPASIKFLAEDDALSGYENPEVLYLTHILPAKVACQLEYVQNYSVFFDAKLILLTALKIMSPRAHARSEHWVRSLLP